MAQQTRKGRAFEPCLGILGLLYVSNKAQVSYPTVCDW